MVRLFRLVLVALLMAAPAVAQPPQTPPVLLAAASLQEALGAAADAWARAGHARPMLSFAASSAAARQVLAGAPADLFVSADRDWMDVVERAGRSIAGTRADLAGNRLVVVARRDSGTRLTRANLATTLGAGPLAMADPDAVPAGRYGRTALQRMGAWTAASGRVVRAESVRAALSLVERGAVPYGIVYATDARASARVRIVGIFPAASHQPILYPVARLRNGRSSEAEGFRRFLLSREGGAILTRFGFTRP